VQARSDAPDCDVSELAVVAAGIRRQLRIVPVEANDGGEIDACLARLAARLASSQSNGPIFGISICIYNLFRSQADDIAVARHIRAVAKRTNP
jgi:hypothetical protein